MTINLSVTLKNILSSAKSDPGTAYYFHANVRATSQHSFERSCGHSEVRSVVAQLFSVIVISGNPTNTILLLRFGGDTELALSPKILIGNRELIP